MTFDPNRLIAIIGKQAAEIEELRVVLKRLLLNYSAALPEGQKDQRSIAEARRLLGLDDQQSESRECLHGRKLPPCTCGWPDTCCRQMYPQWHPDEPPEPSTYFDGETWRSR